MLIRLLSYCVVASLLIISSVQGLCRAAKLKKEINSISNRWPATIIRSSLGLACFSYGAYGVFSTGLDLCFGNKKDAFQKLMYRFLALGVGSLLVRGYDIYLLKKLYQWKGFLLSGICLGVIGSIAGEPPPVRNLFCESDKVNGILCSPINWLSVSKGIFFALALFNASTYSLIVPNMLLNEELYSYSAYDRRFLNENLNDENIQKEIDEALASEAVVAQQQLQLYFNQSKKSAIPIQMPIISKQSFITRKQEVVELLFKSPRYQDAVSSFRKNGLPDELIMHIFSFVDILGIEVPAFFKELALELAPKNIKKHYKKMQKRVDQKEEANLCLIMPWKAAEVTDNKELQADCKSVAEDSDLSCNQYGICLKKMRFHNLYVLKKMRFNLYVLIKKFVQGKKPYELYQTKIDCGCVEQFFASIRHRHTMQSSLLESCLNHMFHIKSERLRKMDNFLNAGKQCPFIVSLKLLNRIV